MQILTLNGNPGTATTHALYALHRRNLKKNVTLVLKEQCHEDFAVLGQFCPKIITLRL